MQAWSIVAEIGKHLQAVVVGGVGGDFAGGRVVETTVAHSIHLRSSSWLPEGRSPHRVIHLRPSDWPLRFGAGGVFSDSSPPPGSSCDCWRIVLLIVRFIFFSSNSALCSFGGSFSLPCD